MDPLLACLTLVSDSSLSIIQRLSSVIIPATTVSWIHSKKKPQIEMKEIEDVEARITDLEVEIKLLGKSWLRMEILTLRKEHWLKNQFDQQNFRRNLC